MPDNQDVTSRTDIAKSGPRQHRGGIGFPVFLVLAGLALLAERLGWLSNGFDWLFPIVLIAWGLSEFYDRTSAR